MLLRASVNPQDHETAPPLRRISCWLHVPLCNFLQDIIIEGIYRKLFGGKLDQKNELVRRFLHCWVRARACWGCGACDASPIRLIHQRGQLQLRLDFVIGRDIKPGELDKMIDVLGTWCTNCEGLLSEMMGNMDFADARKAADVADEEKLVAEVRPHECRCTLLVCRQMEWSQ